MIQRGANPSIGNFRSLAKALGYTLQELFEGDEVRLNLFIHGITTGDSMWAEIPSRHARVVPLTLASENMVSVEISHLDAAPQEGYRTGDIVSGEKVPFSDNLKGRDVIAKAKDGKFYVGKLFPGTSEKRNALNIRPFNGGEERQNLILEWVAPIQFIIRGDG
jgi:hypothetical protein